MTEIQLGSRLEARHLKKAYGSRKVVHDVSVQVGKGEVVGLLGPNGAGKTTSFYMIVGLVRTDGGQILIDGQDGWNTCATRPRWLCRAASAAAWR
jgi:lipopolysaccharide export system ATP-binding protein